MIEVTEDLSIGEDELHFDFIRASGPGGQKINKTASAVQLRFDASGSPSLSEDVRRRLKEIAGNAMTQEGELVIHASRFRSQRRNREGALERLIDLLRAAAKPPKRRKKTRPSRSSKERRLEKKRRRSEIKRLRRRVDPADF